MEKFKPAPAQLSCDVCLREIPRSAAMTAEGADYVGEFCGLECYQEFLKAVDAAAVRAVAGVEAVVDAS